MRIVTLLQDEVYSGPLVLVNRRQPLKVGLSDGLIPIDARHPKILLDRTAAKFLAACIQEVGGEEEIVPVSGWRSRTEQKHIWNQALEDHGVGFSQKYVAPPGCSEHQTGLVIDLGRAAEEIDFLRPYFPDTGKCGVFRRLAVQYGFIQRYRREKEILTGIAEEPWHFRYVGVPHALLIEANGLCLEEYVEFLRDGDQTVKLPDGQCAHISYVPCSGKETAILLPEGCCQVSGDNCGGFIVTSWGCSA